MGRAVEAFDDLDIDEVSVSRFLDFLELDSSCSRLGMKRSKEPRELEIRT